MRTTRAKPKLTVLVAFAALGAAGCVGSSNSSPQPGAGNGFDAALPPETTDGSVLVDGAVPLVDGAIDAATTSDASAEAGKLAAFVTGLGPAVVARSAHFTVITKTGNEPGGAGVKTSPSFTMISGVAPAATK